MLDFLYPREGNPWVTAFHAVFVAVNVGVVYWLWFRNGWETMADARDALWYLGIQAADSKQLRLQVGALFAVGLIAYAAICWGAVIPDVRQLARTIQ